MPNELGVIDNWVHDALAAKTNLNTLVDGQIWDEVAKQNAAFPYCLYGFQGGRDFQGLGLVRLMTSPLYYAKLVFQTSATSAVRLALDEIDNAMGYVSVSVSEGYVVSARRFTILKYHERDAQNKPIFHRGGLYRLEVSVA